MHNIPRMTPNSPHFQLRFARFAAKTFFLLDGLIFASWVTRIPTIQEKLDLDNAALGMALLMMSIGGMVAMPLAGWLVAHLGSRWGVLFATLLFGLSLPLLALPDGVLLLSLVLLLFGAGFGAMNVAINTQAVSVERHYRRKIMSSFHAAFSLGGIAGALLGGFAASQSISPLVHFSLVGLLSVALTLTLARSLASDLVEEPTLSFTDETGHKTRCLLLGLLAFCAMLSEGAMADWSAVFLKQVSQAQPFYAAMGFAAFSTMMTIGRLAGDYVTTSIGANNTVRLGGTLTIFGITIAVLFPHTAMVILGFSFVGAGISAMVPTIFSAAAKIPGITPAVAIATVSTVGYFGFLVGPPLIGFASEFATLRWALGLVLLAGLAIVSLSRTVEVRDVVDRKRSDAAIATSSEL
ncbi:MFS transporter [Blastopirellula marina]|uniref:MFS transporter n=1 Tax=Blastopirellula marina TaxID=124 RepID=A0A2S8F9J2_9BACT|nr:MFS transporter [Blastopirellula marina]PQO28833.1 MFS transporter [Blastopirellula marina]PTL42106.1 MFS transporter [Blastopirellula marina]